ncbi:MAG: esterase family protein [Armatimonadota bacterium]|nr:esterase family protein [Armatimonadota bacterium]
MRRSLPLWILLWTLAVAALPSSPARAKDEVGGPLRFQITLAPGAAAKAVSGRLFVLMSDAPGSPKTLSTGFIPGKTGLAAQEVTSLAPGQSVTLDPDALAYPTPFSQSPAGTYHFQALLDTHHDYAYAGRDSDDVSGPVVTVKNINPAQAGTVNLTLTQSAARPFQAVETANVKPFTLNSKALSDFWGRPITMRAAVVLPPDYARDPKRRFGAVYHVHGFGGNWEDAWSEAPAMRGGTRAPFVHIFLDASCPGGHDEFADSVNNGPWGRALTEEFIPALEQRFRLVAQPDARFLTGHSSGGWSTLWLQVTYPDFFGGTWSTSPDPVDLHDWTGVDVTPGSRDNVYRTPDGKPRNLVRAGGREGASIEEFAKQEQVEGEYGGQFASFEWVWSPRGPDGRPLTLFSRATGEQDTDVQRAWQKYDIRRILETNWGTLGPKLRGKIHVFCGGADTFHLDGAVRLLQAFFRRVGSDAVCEIIPDRSHFDLYEPYTTYPDGLDARIDREMRAAFESRAVAPPKQGLQDRPHPGRRRQADAEPAQKRHQRGEKQRCQAEAKRAPVFSRPAIPCLSQRPPDPQRGDGQPQTQQCNPGQQRQNAEQRQDFCPEQHG